MCVALGIQHLMRKCQMSSVASPLIYFPTLSHKRHDFRKKKVIGYNIFLIFSTKSARKNSHYKDSARYDEKYRVIHKSVKYFKNSQQIEYAINHGNSYANRERNSPSFFINSQCNSFPDLPLGDSSNKYGIQ
jgi:hypothetical protein